ncbi:MAG TPA: hypothetical protein DDW52_19195, partial [Planctomycetaceae bacterium]|nr:hypothetical protein [Planctomycetaceae bacterium]
MKTQHLPSLAICVHPFSSVAKLHLSFVLAAIFLLSHSSICAAAPADKPMNVLFLVADDLN